MLFLQSYFCLSAYHTDPSAQIVVAKFHVKGAFSFLYPTA